MVAAAWERKRKIVIVRREGDSTVVFSSFGRLVEASFRETFG
jgi:hypothetical protein